MTSQVKSSVRDTRRRQTRERVFAAAFAEFKRAGMTGADVKSIAASAGVAHGTLFFHFPSKEHILVELVSREEARLATQFAAFLEKRHELDSSLRKLVAMVTGLERRLGPILFKELLASHFSPTRPVKDDWTDHPLIVLLVREIERAGCDGVLHPEVDAFYSATFFLLGVYGILTTTHDAAARRIMLTKLVTTAVLGLGIR
jgi:AcrR family transcriptional regulator